jgi:hypothetical protein
MAGSQTLINRSQLRMPKGPDSAGIIFNGPVLTGRLSVQEAQAKTIPQPEYPGIPIREHPMPLPGKL